MPTKLRYTLSNIGEKVVRHSRYIKCQLALRSRRGDARSGYAMGFLVELVVEFVVEVGLDLLWSALRSGGGKTGGRS